MTLYAGTIIDVPGDPFAGDPAEALEADADGALLVRDGVIRARGPLAALRAITPEAPRRSGESPLRALAGPWGEPGSAATPPARG